MTRRFVFFNTKTKAIEPEGFGDLITKPDSIQLNHPGTEHDSDVEGQSGLVFSYQNNAPAWLVQERYDGRLMFRAYDYTLETWKTLLSIFGVDNDSSAGVLVVGPLRAGTVVGSLSQHTASANTHNNNIGATQHVSILLDGNVTIYTPSSPVNGQELTFHLRQDATGGRTVNFISDYKKASGLALGTTANTVNVITFVYNGSAWYQKAASLGLPV